MAAQRMLLCLLILGLLFVSVAEGAVAKPTYVMCRSQKVVRTIRIVNNDDGCSAIYTKAGVDRVVGSGKNWQSCKDVVANIRTNLEGAAWKCKEISSYSVSEFSN